MADDGGWARVYDLRTFTDRRGRSCALCASPLTPGTAWADLEGRVWDICRSCGDEAARAAAHSGSAT